MTREQKALIDCVPNNWLDPLLTGPNKIIGKEPFTCRDIENILNAIRKRMSVCAAARKAARKKGKS